MKGSQRHDLASLPNLRLSVTMRSLHRRTVRPSLNSQNRLLGWRKAFNRAYPVRCFVGFFANENENK